MWFKSVRDWMEVMTCFICGWWVTAALTRKLSSTEDRDQTDCVLALTLTLTCDLQFHSPASYGSDPHMQKIKAKGQSVQKMEWKQKKRWMDRRTEAIALPHVLMRSVINIFNMLVSQTVTIHFWISVSHSRKTSFTVMCSKCQFLNNGNTLHFHSKLSK